MEGEEVYVVEWILKQEDISITFYGKDIQSLRHCGNQSRHFLSMVTCWHFINDNINFLKNAVMEMNSLNTIMWTILETFDKIFYNLNLILLAINLDEVASLLEQEPAPPSYTFDPFQTIRKYE